MSLDQLHCNRENGNGTDERTHDGVEDLVVHDVSPSKKGETCLRTSLYAAFNACTNAVLASPACKNGMAPEKAMPFFFNAVLSFCVWQWRQSRSSVSFRCTCVWGAYRGLGFWPPSCALYLVRTKSSTSSQYKTRSKKLFAGMFEGVIFRMCRKLPLKHDRHLLMIVSNRKFRADRGVAQPGSASGLGPEGRRFESCLPDHFSQAA